MAQEQQFLRALGATTEFRITGDTLTLTDATGAARVYFEAIYLR